jgi:hypothetical protein
MNRPWHPGGTWKGLAQRGGDRPRRGRAALFALLLLPALCGGGLLSAAPASATEPAGLPPDPLMLLAIQQAQLSAADGAAQDYFGTSVALDGDTALVGAPEDDIGANGNQGSAYVFARSGTTWSGQAQLIAADGAAEDYFGYSVALAGDTALVGAPYDRVGGNAAQGSAYVFARSGSSWTQQQQLTAADGAAEDNFGYSVALAGDTALVGAPYDRVGGNAAQGSACVFTRSGTTWSGQAQLTAADGAALDHFGTSVALAGETALVGAYYDDVGGNADQGSAYVFTRSGTSWSGQAQLSAGDGAAEDYFGTSVALAGETALVGAPYDVIGSNAAQGSAYVFVLDRVAPTTTATLTPAANAAGWNNATVTLTLTAADSGGSGLDRTYYRFGSGGAFAVYDPAARPTLGAEGTTTVEYYSTDAAGNVEAAKTATVRVDTRKPSTKAFKASVKKGRKVKLAYRVNDPVPGCGQATVTLKLFKGRKLKKTIRIKGASACNVKKTHSWKCTLPKGAYTLKVYATDLAGNAQSKVGGARLTVK